MFYKKNIKKYWYIGVNMTHHIVMYVLIIGDYRLVIVVFTILVDRIVLCHIISVYKSHA